MDDDEVPQLLDISDADGVQNETVDPFERPKVPITLLTGYLGAGKSTLLEYILTENHGYRIAVCMNDFGDTTDIETKALQLSNPTDPDAPSTELLSLPNGCLCCSVKDMGIAAIEDMVAAQRDKIDWVVVELTGLADPAPIAKSFWANEEMGDLVLDAVVCVVDSRNILKQLSEHGPDNAPSEAQRQVACADVILLNKVDLVPASDLDSVASAVAHINPTLRVHRTTRSQVPLGALFDLRAYERPISNANEATPNGNGNEECAECTSHTPHTHTDIATTTVRLPPLSPPQLDNLTAFLEDLLWNARVAGWESEDVPEILRTKGYVELAEGDGAVADGDDGQHTARVIQGVADLFEIRACPAGDVQPKMVFIGRGVDARLGEALRARVGV